MTGMSTGGDADMDSAFRQLRSQGGNASSIFIELEAFFEKAKTGLNNLLHSLTRTSKESHLIFMAGSLIEAGQLASLALPASSTMDMNYPTPVAKLAEIIGYTRFGDLMWEHFDHFTVAIVVQSVLLVLLLALPYIAYTWANKEGRSIGTKLLQYQMSIYGGIFFIPIITCLAEGAFCSKFEGNQCKFFMPIAIIELIVYIVLVLLVSIMYFDSRPVSKSMTSRPHARIHVLSVFIRAVLTLIFVGAHNVESGSGLVKIWVVVVAVSLTLLGLGYTWYQPYYHQRANAIRALLTMAAAWLAICSMVHVLASSVTTTTSSSATGEECVYTSDSTVTVTVFGGLILILPLTWVALHYRRYTLHMKRPNQCANVFELELKGRLELQGLGIHHVSDLSKADKDVMHARAMRVHKWYMEAASLFPLSGTLFMFHAQMLLAFLPKKTPMVRRAIVIAAKRGLAPDFHVIVYKVRRTLEETIKGSSDVLSIVRSEEYTTEALKYDKRCSTQLVDFWSELSEKRPDINKVRRLALNIAVSSAAAHKAYLKLLRISPNQILNQVNQMIVGQKIDSFFVSPLAERFEEIVESFMEDGNDEAFEDTINTFLRTPTGNVVAVNLKLQPYAPDDVNFNIYIVFQADTSHSGENFIVVNETDGMVEGMGSACFAAFQSHILAASQQRQFQRMGGVAFGGVAGQGGPERLHVSTLIPNYSIINPQRLPSGMPIPVTLQEEDSGVHLLKRFRITFASDEPNAQRRDSCEGGAPDASSSRPRLGHRPSIMSLLGADDTESTGRGSFCMPGAAPEAAVRRASTAPGASDNGESGDTTKKRSSVMFSPMRRMSSVYSPPEHVKGKIWIHHKQVLGKRYLQVFMHDPEVPEFNTVDERFEDRGAMMDVGGQSEFDDASMGNAESDFGTDSDAKGRSGGPGGPVGGLIRRTFTDKSEHMRRFMEEMDSEAKITTTPRARTGGSRAGSKAGSVSSGEVLRHKAQAVRKTLQESQNAAMDSTLAKLRRMYLRASILVCVCALAQYVNSTSLLDEYSNDIQLVGSLGFRRFCLVAIAYAAHGLNLINRGILDASEESHLRSELGTFGNTLKNGDFELFQRRATVGGSLQTTYEEPSFDYYFLRNGYVMSSRMSLFEATMKLSSSALQAEQADLSEFTPGSATTLPLMENLDFFSNSTLTGLEQTTEQFADYALQHSTVILHQLLVMASTMLFVTIILVGVAIYPLVGNGGKIEKVKGEILQVFADIPKKTTQEVGLRFVERLSVIHEEDVDASRLNGEHPATRGHDELREAGMDPRTASGAAGGMLSHITDASTPHFDTQTREPKKVAKVAPEIPSADRSKPSPRAKKKGGSSSKSKDEHKTRDPCCTVRKAVISAKMSSLLFLAIIYFASVVLLTAKLEWDTESAPAVANYAGYRRMKMRYVMHEFRLWLTGAFEGVDMVTIDGEHIDFRSDTDHVRHRLATLQEIHEKLLYGKEADHIVGTFRDSSANDDLMELYTTNGCLNLPSTSNRTEAECLAFDNGLMATGLQSAFTNFIDAMQELTYDTEIDAAAHSRDDAIIRTIFERDDVQRLIELEKHYLQPQFSTVIQIGNTDLAARVAHVEIMMLILLIGLIVCAFCIYAFVVRTILTRLDMEVKRTRSLLLVIPEDVLDSLRHIQVFLVDSFGTGSTGKK
ncbi:Tiny macrocysts protein C [Hondaea fermentalgiana]|uniref:Tiny macrocysts protein C n=1 Tax=Hondaea fermentalgiana TaxID=2315210 RepID=A0A2R5G7Z2_9STRA|nr:Tiny macrocysts protein C [Hondaea fermentalgiana]|eukprot:GBG27110.1 Tiny macrocysts protein C [Hondaea fermentalgiana]